MLRRWLLHQLPEDQSQALEARSMQDESFGMDVHTVETDLLDDFARGRLDAADRAAVARHLLATPADRARLRFAAALARAAAAAPAADVTRRRRAPRALAKSESRWSRRRTLAWGGLAAACVVVLAVAITLQRGSRPSGNMAQTMVTVALADPRRGAAVTEIRVPRGTAKVRLQAEVDSDALGARYTLTVADGARTLARVSHLAPRRAGPYRYVEIVMPAAALGEGERRVSLAIEGSSAPPTTWSIDVGTDGSRAGAPTRR